METSGGNFFTNEVEVNLDVFHASMENGISREISGTNVVAPQCWRWQRDVKLTEKRSDPEKLRCGVSNGFVFNFSTRASDGRLFLGAPRNKIVTEVDEISACRSTVRGVTRPVGIAEGREKDRRSVTKVKPMSDGAFKISKKMLEASPIMNLRRVHRSAGLINNIANVGTREVEIL